MTTLVEQYRALVGSGALEFDQAQALLIEKLQLLSNRLSSYAPPEYTDLLSYFTRHRGEVPKGLYIFGKVGRGKTLAMDMFFKTVPFTPKRRYYFHEFMIEVHKRIAIARKTSEGDPIKTVAKTISDEAALLCFDELHVTDIADAMVLGRLFDRLLKSDVIIVSTSNAHPADLYKDGLNRQLFLPFIELIEDYLEVYELAAQQDYRLAKLAGQRLYFTPLGEDSNAQMDVVWKTITGGATGISEQHDLAGRILRVPQTAMGSARFSFEEICGRPLGAEDYLTLARAYHTIFIDDIPVLTPSERNEARRFINLIDTLYDNRVKLVISADAEPDRIYQSAKAAEHFERTISRLIEMRSEEYLAAPHGRADGITAP